MFKDWKTTTIGIGLIVSGIVGIIADGSADTVDWQAITAGLGLILSRDANIPGIDKRSL